MKDKELKELAKDIVLHCFRNTHLENIHAGEKNGGVGAGFSNEEMRILMIEAVDNVYTWLTVTQKDSKYTFRDIHMPYLLASRSSHDNWNEPKLLKHLIQKKK